MSSAALAEQLAILRARGEEFRLQAAKLEEKILRLERDRADLRDVRIQLHDMTVRLHRAVGSLLAIGPPPRRRARGTGRR